MPTINRIDEFNPDYDTQATLDAGKKRKPGITIATPPGGAYLQDQMEQARLAGGARGAGIAARGLLTSPLVAGYEAMQRVGQDAAGILAPVARGAVNFTSGLVGTDAPAAPTANAATAAPAAPSNFGMNNRGEDYVQPRPVPQFGSFDQAPMTPAASIAPASNKPNPAVRMDAGWQATADLAAAKRAGTGRVKGIGGGLTSPDEYGDAPGYRGPQAPGRGIAGDFDFATNAAADFAARTGNTRQAKGIGDYIAARDAAARGDTQMKSYADNSLTQAQAGESQQRGILSGTQAADIQATRPGRIDAITAGIGQTQAQTAEAQARTGRTTALAPGELETQSLANTMAKMDVKARTRLDDLSTKIAAATDPKAIAQLGAQYLAMLGKDKPEEYTVAHAAGAKGLDGSAADTIVVVNKRTGKAEIVPTTPMANPTEAMAAIKQAGGDANKIAAIKARFAANGGDPAMLK